MMGADLGAWLRRQRQDRAWARLEMARQMISAARARGDTSLPSADNVENYIYRWERGTTGISERYKLYYCLALGIAPAEFGRDQSGGGREALPGRAVFVIMIPGLLGLPHLWKDVTMAAGSGGGVTQADSRDIDVAAAKHLLGHMRGTLECLTADMINFQNALDGPPGMLAAFADEVLDREWRVDGMDIRDFMP